ncbi:MAG: C25 family cysteine peptidase [Thermofilum sp.]|nr:C25 family cysteine peptidase [Thermofilum sp.]
MDYVENEIFGLMRKAVNLELYVEDADKMVLVNKAPGDLVDLVAQIKNEEREELNVDVTIQVPADFEFKTSFVRNSFTDVNEVPVNSRNLGGGKYVVTTLVKSGEAKQVVWRFKIPDNFGTNICVKVNGDVKVGGIFCDGDQVMFNMVNNVASIIVTNRKLLFEKYGDSVIKGGTDEVLKLLRELYFLSDWRTYSGVSGIVYYVDHYSEDAKNWDQKVDYTDETTANKVANIIDDYIEKWAKKTNPKYLMIVGGDEIIPFYRIKIKGYSEKPETVGWSPDQINDPVLNAYTHDYFLTDMKYADLDDKDWTRGSINLATGRITGASAGDMRKLIENGIKGPVGSNNAVVGTAWPEPKLISGINLLKVRKKLNILNDGEPAGEIPKTFNAGGWGADDLINAMKKGFIIFEHSVHGDYDVFACEDTPYFNLRDSKIYSMNFISDKDLRDSIAKHRPFFITDSCHTGVITDVDGTNWNPEAKDNLAWAIINAGASGYKALTSFGWSGYSDKLDGIYYSYLTKPTYTVGDALKYAVIKYKPWWIPGFLFWPDVKNEVAVTEPILYGVPWMTIDPPESLQAGQGSVRNDFKINVSRPQYVAPNTYKIIVEVNVMNYSISKLDSFDIIKINGSDETRADGMPILPMIVIPVALPKGSNVSLSIVQNISTTIGYYNIPCFLAIRKGSNGTAVASCTNITGMVPVPSYGLYISDFDDYREAAIVLALAQHDPQTKKTILYNYTELEVTYQSPIPVTITDFLPDKIEYTSGEAINVSVTVENIGSNNLINLRANLSLKDPQGRIVASSEKLFNIASGESRTIYVTLTPHVPHGVYLAEMSVLGDRVLALSSKYITVKTGEIVDFSCDKEVKSGGLENFTISFRNGYQNSIKATGVVYIYDRDYIKVGEVYSAPIQIPANTTYDIKVSWDTTGRNYGNYKASAVVLIGDEQFGPVYCSFTIKGARLGDINRDGIVDYKDLAILISKYGTKKGNIEYYEDADLNNDGEINYKDLAILISNYGEKT